MSGVAADDVLNVRAEPDAGSAIVTTIPPDRRDLEVLHVSDDGKWARVGLGENAGWVAARFIAPETPRGFAQLPAPLRCSGTEPFWGLWIPTPDFAEFERLPDPERQFSIAFQGQSVGGSSTDLAAVLDGEHGSGTLIVRRETCTGNMADREFGLSARLVLTENAESTFYAGCCALTGH